MYVYSLASVFHFAHLKFTCAVLCPSSFGMDSIISDTLCFASVTQVTVHGYLDWKKNSMNIQIQVFIWKKRNWYHMINIFLTSFEASSHFFKVAPSFFLFHQHHTRILTSPVIPGIPSLFIFICYENTIICHIIHNIVISGVQCFNTNPTTSVILPSPMPPDSLQISSIFP